MNPNITAKTLIWDKADVPAAGLSKSHQNYPDG